MSKLYDVVVKTGSYTDAQGQNKNRYENIGVVMDGDNGPYMLMKKTFNPAGVSSDRDTIMVSLFKPNGGQGNQPQQHPSQQPAQSFGNNNGKPAPPPKNNGRPVSPPQNNGGFDDFEDDVPGW